MITESDFEHICSTTTHMHGVSFGVSLQKHLPILGKQIFSDRRPSNQWPSMCAKFAVRVTPGNML